MKTGYLQSVLLTLCAVHALAWFPGLGSDSDTICQKALYYESKSVYSAPGVPPYTIHLDQPTCLPGTPMKVEIRSTGKSKFQGLIIQVRSLHSQVSVGDFSQSAQAKFHTCNTMNDTLLFWSATPASDVTLTWTAPDVVDNLQLQFVANIFENSTTLWPNVTSTSFQKGFPPIDVTSCGKTKGCFRYSEDRQECSGETCEYLFTYTVHQGEMVTIEMSGMADWIAIGFSSDKLMGGDDVLMCEQDSGRGASINHYRTDPNYMGVTRQGNKPIEAPEIEIVNGRLNCRFQRPVKVPRDETSVDLSNDCYHLYVWGQKSMGNIKKHTLDSPPTSEKKVSLLMSPINIIGGTSSCSPPSLLLCVLTGSWIFTLLVNIRLPTYA